MSSGSSKEKERAVESPRVDCSASKKPLWLVKVPKYMSEQWEQRQGQEVGKVKIMGDTVVFISHIPTTSEDPSPVATTGGAGTSAAAGGFKRGAVTLNMQPMAIGKVAKVEEPAGHDFVVNNNKLDQTLAVCCEDKTNIYHNLNAKSGKLSIVGRINSRAEIRPQRTNSYFAMKSRQIELFNKPKNKLKQMERAEVKFKPVDIHREQLAREKEKRDGSKAVRGDRDEVRNLLFTLFEKHQYYKLVDLQTLTNQPPSFLKELLNEIAHYNTAPPHRAMWELKPEYTAYKSEQT